MIHQNFKAEGETSDCDLKQAADRIGLQKKRMAAGSRTDEQKADDQQLLNEMRGNEASLGLNRAMHEYNEEQRDGGHEDGR